jgi:hypothetical protein
MAIEKALEICKNLNQTIRKYTHTAMSSGSSKSVLQDNTIWSSTKASKSMLEKKLNYLMKEYKIKRKEL